MDKLDHLGWVVSNFYEIGGIRLGIRSTSEAFGSLFDEALADYRAEPGEGRPYYGVVVGGAGENGRGERGFHILYRGSQAAVRTLSLSTLITALVSEFQSYLLPDREDAIYVDAALVSSNGTVALVPSVLVSTLGGLGKRVQKAGLALPAETHLAIDLQSDQVVPIGPFLQISEQALEALRGLAPRAPGDDRRVVDRPTVVDVVLTIGALDAPLEPVSRGQIVASLASQVVNLPKLGVSALEGLARLAERAQCYAIQAHDPRSMLDTLAAKLRST